MKKILLGAWNISAVWAILTCVYCGLDGKISTDTKIMLWNDWYIPLLSRYWDWAFAGLCFLLLAFVAHRLWLPHSKFTKADDAGIWWIPPASVLCYSGILPIVFLWNHKTRVIFPDQYTAVNFCFWIAMILSYTGRSKESWAYAGGLSFVIITISHSAYLAFLMLSSTMIIKIAFWLVVNIIKSGFQNAIKEWWENMKLKSSVLKDC